MNRLRIGFALTVIIASIYAASGLFTSLLDFGIGVAVAALAMCGYGALDYVEDHRHEREERRAAMQYHPSNWWRDV